MNRLAGVYETGIGGYRKLAGAARLFALGLLLVFPWCPVWTQEAEILSAISNMTVVQKSYGVGGGLVSLGWTNGTRYTFLELFIDGRREAEIDGGLNEHTIENLSAGQHELGLQGQSGDLVSQRVNISFTVLPSTPLREPVAEVSCSYIPGGGGTIEVTWSPGADGWSSGVLQLGDGENLEIAAGATSVTAEGVGPEVPALVIFFRNAAGYFSDRIVPVCSLRPAVFLRGDCNSDGGVNISDAIFQLNHLYLGRERWYCDDACDANDDGRTNLSDAVTIIGYVFFGEIEPIGMVPTCGPDETDDFLGGICECPS
ncbi:MAG: dockerin type I domain-containing protein [Planctomycetota bacterium]